MKNKALLVGINQYPDPRNSLRGCINDILDMENFISQKNKVYPSSGIKKLTDKAATKKGILTQLEWLLEGAEAGDQLLFHYSGHGAQLPCKKLATGTLEEVDGLDEIICPYDFDGTDATTIRDNDFGAIFSRIPKGVHFVWISDSCHSADLSRDPIVGLEEHSVLFRNFGGLHIAAGAQRIAANTSSSPLAPANLQGALLSACASHELSADAYINNRFNGAFTHYLIKQLSAHAESLPMQKIIQLVSKDLEDNYYDQRPQTEGLLAGQKFFI
jgi:hypothetical protein